MVKALLICIAHDPLYEDLRSQGWGLSGGNTLIVLLQIGMRGPRFARDWFARHAQQLFTGTEACMILQGDACPILQL